MAPVRSASRAARRQAVGRPLRLLLGACGALALAAPGLSAAWAPLRPSGAAALRLASTRTTAAPATALRAAKEDGRTDEERLEFMNSPIGQVIGAFAGFLSSSPLNDGKIWLAKLQAGDYDRAVVGSKIDAYIKENPVTVFSFSKCPFCLKAKKELNEIGAKYVAVELDQMGDEGKHIRAELAERTKRTSVPNIFIGGQGIGGCNEGPGLITLKNNGELTPMLEKVGALR